MKFYHITLLLFSPLLFILFECEPLEEKTPAQQWEHFISGQKALGCEVLSVAASQVWIEEHRDEISIPNQIVFGKPHHVQDFGFVPYGIMIAVDANDKRRVIARKWPPEKTLLKVGDTLILLFPFNSLFQREFSFDNSKEIEIDPNEHWKNVTSNFVFEAKETIVHPNFETFADDNFICTTYMSPNGATISCKLDDNGIIVTKIEGSVFKRNHNLLFVYEPPQEESPPPPGVETPAQQWEHFISGQKALGREVLSVAASQVWIEKHRDEISIPNQIVFGKSHHVQDFGFAPYGIYGIMIAVDANDKRRVIARKWPPEKTLLKVGDTLTTAGFPIGDLALDLDNFGSGSEAVEAFKKHFENQTSNFVFEAKEIIFRMGLPVPNYKPFVEAKVEQAKAEEAFYNSVAPGKWTIYMSPNGATISYNGFRIVTKIEGSVFQSSYDLTAIATSLLE